MEDMCHLPPNRCNSRGRLTHLVLAGMGLRCASIPEAVMTLEGLERLDLSNNNLGAATFYDMANVSGEEGLERGGKRGAIWVAGACWVYIT
jgi:hypothetical protein